MRRDQLILTLASMVLLSAAPARAQQGDLAGCTAYLAQSSTVDRLTQKNEAGIDEKLTILRGSVRVDCDTATQFFADEAHVFHDRNRVVAIGQVLYVSGGNRISAERMEFDTKTRTGTFYNASGIVTLGARAERSLFGTQEPDATFRGREVHKVGPDKYRIVDGAFTSCVQPTPRWEVSSGSITVNLEDYVLLTNSIFRVKGVPVMYLPAFYYPIQEDDRATGFLMPTYGASTVKGQILSNAFFWAMGRSHDATFTHDWFTKTGQGFGGEYRYEVGGGSAGNLRTYMLSEKETTSRNSAGQEVVTPAARNYQVVGGMTQGLGGGLRARANVDYFTDLGVQQRYQQDVYQATRRTRRFGGNISGNWREYVLSATMERNDYFNSGSTESVITGGSLPRVTFNRGERPLGRSPLYFGVNSEYVTLLQSEEAEDVTLRDQGLTRFDVNPFLRVPFNRWPFLSITSSLSWRATYWTESLDTTGSQVPDPIGRHFWDMSARFTGPVLTKIFNTPESGFAEKLKHVIEPTLVIRRRTAIDEFDQIVKLEGTDYTRGNVTELNYGLNNRLYAKQGTSREILNIGINQKFYTDELAAQYDQQFQTSFSGTKPSKFSPVRLVARTSPTDRLLGEFTTEWDHTVRAFRTFGATGTLNRDVFQISAGWSQRRFIEGLPGFEESRADHYLNANTNVRSRQNRVGGTYTFNYDLRRDTFLQQRYLFYYNAQCCGFGVEYQAYNFPSGLSGVTVTKDRRFNLSFTLAGIGTFSNFLGAFGGKTDR